MFRDTLKAECDLRRPEIYNNSMYLYMILEKISDAFFFVEAIILSILAFPMMTFLRSRSYVNDCEF